MVTAWLSVLFSVMLPGATSDTYSVTWHSTPHTAHIYSPAHWGQSEFQSDKTLPKYFIRIVGISTMSQTISQFLKQSKLLYVSLD